MFKKIKAALFGGDKSPAAESSGNPTAAAAAAAATPEAPAITDFEPRQWEIEGFEDPQQSPLKGQVEAALKKCFDPEIPVNIYDMGLIYHMKVNANGTSLATITLTSPNCPAAEEIPADIQEKVTAVEGVEQCEVKIVWEPPFDKDMMSEAAKLELGMDDMEE